LANHLALFALFAGVEMLSIIIVAIHTLPELKNGLMSSPGWLMMGEKWNTGQDDAVHCRSDHSILLSVNLGNSSGTFLRFLQGVDHCI